VRFAIAIALAVSLTVSAGCVRTHVTGYYVQSLAIRGDELVVNKCRFEWSDQTDELIATDCRGKTERLPAVEPEPGTP
jgi:hypothetical protein